MGLQLRQEGNRKLILPGLRCGKAILRGMGLRMRKKGTGDFILPGLRQKTAIRREYGSLQMQDVRCSDDDR